MSVGTDPRYGRLADRVLAAWSIPASGRVDVKRAILAQWQCEQSGGWPPTLNNPGFVTLGALHSWGLDLGAVCGRQLPSFCLARFPSPEAGADAYAGGVLRGSRYAGALAAARAGNGLRFLNLITSAGWGTRYSCCRVAFAGLGGKVPAVTPGSTPNATLTSADADGCTLAGRLGVPCSTIIDEALVQRIADLYMAQFNTPGHQVPGGRDTVVNAYRTKIGQPLSSIGSGGVSGDPFGGITSGIAGVVNDAIGAAATALGEVARNVVVLGFILTLLLLGLFVLATADDRPGPRLPSIVPIPL